MATRTYECLNKNCDNYGIKEYDQSIKEDDFKECPICKGEIRRIYQSIGVKWNTGGICGKINKN